MKNRFNSNDQETADDYGTDWITIATVVFGIAAVMYLFFNSFTKTEYFEANLNNPAIEAEADITAE
jgi:hypothetical protein